MQSFSLYFPVPLDIHDPPSFLVQLRIPFRATALSSKEGVGLSVHPPHLSHTVRSFLERSLDWPVQWPAFSKARVLLGSRVLSGAMTRAAILYNGAPGYRDPVSGNTSLTTSPQHSTTTQTLGYSSDEGEGVEKKTTLSLPKDTLKGINNNKNKKILPPLFCVSSVSEIKVSDVVGFR